MVFPFPGTEMPLFPERSCVDPVSWLASGQGQVSPNGKKIFWSRGNGWVFAGIARILEYLPKRDPQRGEYIAIFRRMAAELVKRQPAG